MNQFIITFDLSNATSADYTRAREELERLGFTPFTPNGTNMLPDTTYVGTIHNVDAATLRDNARDRFAARGLKTSAMFVAGVDGWAAIGKRLRAA